MALTPEQIEAYLLCKEPFLDPSYGNVEGQCAEGRGYVTQDLELAIQMFLSNTLFQDLLKTCEYELNSEKNERVDRYILASGALDLNTFLTIDTKTGRKELAKDSNGTNKLWLLQNALESLISLDENGNLLNTCSNQFTSSLVNQIESLF